MFPLSNSSNGECECLCRYYDEDLPNTVEAKPMWQDRPARVESAEKNMHSSAVPECPVYDDFCI